MRNRRLRAGLCALIGFLTLCPSWRGSVHAQDLPEIPPAADLGRLIRQTMVGFSDAVNAKRFDKLLASDFPSNELLKASSAKEMGEQFKPFIDNHINLSAVKEAEITIDNPPSLVEGVLRVAGHFETTPMRVLFDLAYKSEGGKWRVYGITVGLKKNDSATGPVIPKSARPDGAVGHEASSGGGSAKAPGMQLLSIDNKMRALITGTMIDFNTALQRKDFTQFISKSSPSMQKQVKPAELAEAYGQFIREGVDMSEVAKVEPHFFESPSVSSGVILTLKGYYQIVPLPVKFDASYFKVGSEWKLLSLSVETISPTDLKESLGSGSSSEGKKPAKVSTPDSSDKPEADKPEGEMKKDPDAKDADAKEGEMKKDPDMKKDPEMKKEEEK